MKLRRTDPDIETIVGRIRRGNLDLQPSFQRGEIWDKKRQQRLIDSILRDWYVPAVHVVKTEERQEVLDGQQRLAAIRDFLDNKIRVNGHTEPANDFIESLDNKFFEQLPHAVQESVLQYVIPLVELTDYEPDEPNELFFRLNQAYNLTPPEKRNALHGPARDQVRDLVLALTDSGLLERSMIGFNNLRLAYDDIIARACVSAELNTLRRHINNDVVEEIYRRRSGFSPSTIEAVRQGGDLLLGQIKASAERVKFNKGTLQTWILYSAWAEVAGIALPRTLLGDFESDRATIRRGDAEHEPEISKVLALYDDRASYRVTDVSSVLIRDLSIHLYSQFRYGIPDMRDSGKLREPLRFTNTNAQPFVLDYIETSSWGDKFLFPSVS